MNECGLQVVYKVKITISSRNESWLRAAPFTSGHLSAWRSGEAQIYPPGASKLHDLKLASCNEDFVCLLDILYLEPVYF